MKGMTTMPKRPKPKTKTTSTERIISAAKARRVNRQQAQEEENRAARDMGTLTLWESIKAARKAERAAKFNGKSTSKPERPTVSNLLTD
jgi:hypothetical protein